jgi:hypothetical protein
MIARSIPNVRAVSIIASPALYAWPPLGSGASWVSADPSDTLPGAPGASSRPCRRLGLACVSGKLDATVASGENSDRRLVQVLGQLWSIAAEGPWPAPIRGAPPGHAGFDGRHDKGGPYHGLPANAVKQRIVEMDPFGDRVNSAGRDSGSPGRRGARAIVRAIR